MKTKQEIVDEMLIEAIKQNDLARAEKLFDLQGTKDRGILLLKFIQDETNYTDPEPFLRLFIKKLSEGKISYHFYGFKDDFVKICASIAIKHKCVDLLENIAELNLTQNYISEVINLNSEEMFIALIKGGCRADTNRNNEYTTLIKNSDYRWLKLLIQHSAKINDDFIEHSSFSKEVIELFLDGGANPNIINHRNPLFSNDYDKVKLLLDRGGNPNIQLDRNNTTPLHDANFEISELLIERGADVNAKDNLGWTPLHVASKYDYKKTKLLLDSLAYVNAKANDGETPLYRACEATNTECVKLLLEEGADPMAKTNDGNTPLLISCRKESYECAKLLVDAGADLMERYNGNKTLLHEGAGAELIEFLIKKGLNVNAKDDLGRTPLHYLSMNDFHTKEIKLLIKAGADVNAVDLNFQSPLHLASKEACNKTVQILVKAGADVNAVDLRGNIPLHLATKEDNLAVVRILVDNDSDVEHTNYEGKKPSEYTNYWGATSTKIRAYIQSYVSNKDPKVMERLRADRIKKAMEEQKIENSETKIREEIEKFILAS
jgi:cytohesin